VAQPRFRGSDPRRHCCRPFSAVDGCATIHLRGAGNGARLRGAPTQGKDGGTVLGRSRATGDVHLCSPGFAVVVLVDLGVSRP